MPLLQWLGTRFPEQKTCSAPGIIVHCIAFIVSLARDVAIADRVSLHLLGLTETRGCAVRIDTTTSVQMDQDPATLRPGASWLKTFLFALFSVNTRAAEHSVDAIDKQLNICAQRHAARFNPRHNRSSCGQSVHQLRPSCPRVLRQRQQPLGHFRGGRQVVGGHQQGHVAPHGFERKNIVLSWVGNYGNRAVV